MPVEREIFVLKKIMKCFLLPWKTANRIVEWAEFSTSLHAVLTGMLFVVAILGAYFLFTPINSIGRVIGMLVVAFFVVGILVGILSFVGAFIMDILLVITTPLANLYDKFNEQKEKNLVQERQTLKVSKEGLVKPDKPNVNLSYFIKNQADDPYQISFAQPKGVLQKILSVNMF